MKTCKRKDCTENNPQPKQNFVKDSRYADGYQNMCKSCQKKYNSARFDRNRAKILLQSKTYYSSTIDASRKKRAEYRATHKALQKQLEADWRKKNPGRSREKVRRYQAKKLNATPKWLTEKQVREIQAFYENCPIGHEVDHILPLQGVSVSGFHVLNNLQYLPRSENRKKSNKY
jgi:hypothetical protein